MILRGPWISGIPEFIFLLFAVQHFVFFLQNMKVKCVAVINDTVGTLTSCALQDTKCAIGLIVGKAVHAFSLTFGNFEYNFELATSA